MGKRPRRTFTYEQKRLAVDDYQNKRRTVSEIALELNVAPGLIYKWKGDLEESRVKGRLSELESDGRSPCDAKLIQRQEDEILMYQKKVAELTIINDLLKKIPASTNYQRLKNVSGYDDIEILLAQSKKRVKW